MLKHNKKKYSVWKWAQYNFTFQSKRELKKPLLFQQGNSLYQPFFLALVWLGSTLPPEVAPKSSLLDVDSLSSAIVRALLSARAVRNRGFTPSSWQHSESATGPQMICTNLNLLLQSLWHGKISPYFFIIMVNLVSERWGKNRWLDLSQDQKRNLSHQVILQNGKPVRGTKGLYWM